MAEITPLRPDQFPPLLNQIPDAPTELYVEGVLPDPDHYHYLTVVGSRRFSSYGQQAAQTLISALAGQPVVIVSGLAVGIDAIAHQAALAAGLPTVAVPGSGLGRTVLHPPSNRGLADKIVAAGGALLSEFPPDYPAGLHTFPRRNRLMAGLSPATLIIEAGEKSGTLITGRLAMEYNRDVLVVPGPIFAAGSVGTNRLIRDGATPVTCGDDILEALGLGRSATAQLTLNLETLAPHEVKIIEWLQIEPQARDDLIRQLGLGVSEANSLLAGLEIKGWIKESLGEIRLM